MIVANFIRFTLLTAFRDWLYLGIMLLSLASISLSLFLGNVTLVEQGFTSTVFIGGSVRMVTIIGIVLFVCFHVRRSFENKEVELLLTRPISRVQFVLSYFAGFAVLAMSLVIPTVMMIYLLSLTGMIWINEAGLLYWSLSFVLETLIVLSFAFFVSMILQSAVLSVLATFAFYFISRIIGFFLISVNNPVSTMKGEKWGASIEKILEGMSCLLPRLDMFSKSEWLIYGVVDQMQYWVFIGTAFIYIPLMLIMCIFDFLRKEF
jgi:ABC-type transport system involved in multi-copper enzyme maturation permease subunit